MALGCVTLNHARNCHFTEYKNVHNTTLSTKIALYTYEKMVQIYVGNMINNIIEHYIIYLVFDKIICIAI